jgi:hypothetical protein
MKSQDQYFIVRADRAGVFFGKIKENKTTSVVMQDVRKIYYWDGASAVEQISQDGVKSNSKLTITIPEMEIASPIQIIPCTDKAVKNLKEQKEWKQ